MKVEHESLVKRMQLLAEAGYFAPNSDEPVPSPCVSLCKMNEERTHCMGCWRSLEQIRRWASADDAQRMEVWQSLAQRVGVSWDATVARGKS